jgi:hypothetical protein
MRFANLSLEDANRNGITKWWSGFLYRLFKIEGYFQPNDEMLVWTGEKNKGGVVFDPSPGVHRNLHIVDFSSLYPTVVIQNNIGFTTINCEHQHCNKDHILLPNQHNAKVHLCKIRQGFMPAALTMFRQVRVKIYKPRKEERLYGALAQFFKIFMNAGGYGIFANKGFAFAHIYAAELVTAFARDALFTLRDKLEELSHAKVVYGDSVSPEEAVVIRLGKAVPFVVSIKELWYLLIKKYDIIDAGDTKERMPVQDITIWDGKGWNSVTSLIRHRVHKSIYRVATGQGVVDITQDHSLVDKYGSEFRPEDIQTHNRGPVSAPFPLSETKVAKGVRGDLIKLLFLFSMCGTASRTNTGWPSQRTLRIALREDMAEVGLALYHSCELAIETYNLNPSIYTTAEKKTIIKFPGGSKLYDLVREHVYDWEGKKAPKPIAPVLGLNDRDLKYVFEFLKKLYWKPDRKDRSRWILTSSKEMVVFAALCKYFSHEMTIIPQPRGRAYFFRPTEDFKRKTTVSVVKLPPGFVYDFETTDGMFMAGNILCHNTDSAFAKDLDIEVVEQIEEIMGMEIEIEGFWPLMIQHLKKNYLLISEAKTVTKGMMGKKKNIPNLVRQAFEEAVKGLTIDMTEEGMLDHLYKVMRKYEARLLNRDFSIEDVQITQTLSKDAHLYRSKTPLIKAALSIESALQDKDPGSARSFTKQGVVIEYVRVYGKKEWMHSALVSLHQIDVEYLVRKQLHGVFTQIMEPLGITARKLKETKKQSTLWSFLE